MCYSAGVSFTSAVVLVPVGLLCLQKTLRINNPYWAFAFLPVGFGIQQAFEGGVWWALDASNAEILRLSSLGFIFFHIFSGWYGYLSPAIWSKPKKTAGPCFF